MKRPGEEMRGDGVELVARHTLGEGDLPYERLLGDAVHGDAAMFTRDDSVEAAWRVIDPALHMADPPLEYDAGTWGPDAAVRLLDGGHPWNDPQPERTPPC